MYKSLWNGAAIAALMLVPVSAQAATPSAVAVSQGAAGAVENFYAARRNAPLWFESGREGPAAAELVQILRRAPVDGLASGPQIAAQIEQAIGQARSGDPRAIADAERMMSAAWVVYVQALRAPVPGMIKSAPVPKRQVAEGPYFYFLWNPCRLRNSWLSLALPCNRPIFIAIELSPKSFVDLVKSFSGV